MYVRRGRQRDRWMGSQAVIHATTCMWRAEENFVESDSPSHLRIGSGDWTLPPGSHLSTLAPSHETLPCGVRVSQCHWSGGPKKNSRSTAGNSDLLLSPLMTRLLKAIVLFRCVLSSREEKFPGSLLHGWETKESQRHLDSVGDSTAQSPDTAWWWEKRTGSTK